jgi:L-threonylcarbamoyladenylate synthase
MAPGQLPQHYAPRTPLSLHEPGFWKIAGPGSVDRTRRGLITFTTPDASTGYRLIEVLSPGGDLREAAANLFAAMHRLDAAGLEAIDAERVPPHGLGLAINDRLKRAAAK